MEFFQRSGYGDSHESNGGKNTKIRWIGLGQDNRGTSHGWIQVSLVKFNTLKKSGVGAVHKNPITHEQIHSAGSVFADDQNMYVFGKLGETAAQQCCGTSHVMDKDTEDSRWRCQCNSQLLVHGGPHVC